MIPTVHMDNRKLSPSTDKCNTAPSSMMYDMTYQYKREPLTADEATAFANSGDVHEDREPHGRAFRNP